MSSKYRRPPQTHRPLPWCKPPYKPPLPVTPSAPKYFRLRVTINRNSLGFPSHNAVIYFPYVPQTGPNAWAATYDSESISLGVSIAYFPVSKRYIATFGLIAPIGGTGFWQARVDGIDPSSVQHVVLETPYIANPPDQHGSLEFWA